MHELKLTVTKVRNIFTLASGSLPVDYQPLRYPAVAVSMAGRARYVPLESGDIAW